MNDGVGAVRESGSRTEPGQVSLPLIQARHCEVRSSEFQRTRMIASIKSQACSQPSHSSIHASRRARNKREHEREHIRNCGKSGSTPGFYRYESPGMR
jgi:hypothetical protein